jgi:UDP-N-acetylglucosamine--N-acetylmuramyl-(pentapeptide) pyrophosphoryl-undecaprenol N-acetylglucosamine transferase
MKIVITGGHHSSALPVIEQLKIDNPQIEFYWIGHKHSLLGDKNTTLEYREITALGIPFYHLQAGKVYRTFNLKRLLKIPLGFFQSFYLLLKIKPAVILSFGGYLAAPVVFAGWFLRIPSVTHEQTTVAGYANRFIAKFAKKVLVAWPDSAQYFPRNKVVVTGLPIRKEIFEARSNLFDLTWEIPTIYITAGKTGSVKINQEVGKNLKELLHLANVIHQCGDHSGFNNYESLLKVYQKFSGEVPGKYHVKKFIMGDEIGEVFKKADLIITRSGAHITAEILALEKPAVLVPIPWVSHNEQYKNAEIVRDSGLGIVLEEKDLEEKFLDTVSSAIGNLAFYKLKNQGYRDLLQQDSARIISNEVIKNAK